MIRLALQKMRSVSLALVLAGLTALPGCGGGFKGPKTVAASGTVTYKNAPVAEANVAFLGDGQTQPALAITDANGTFVLTTTKAGDGAVPGTHKVTVTKKMAAPAPKSTDPKAGSMESAVKEYHDSKSKEPPKSLSMIPEKYSQVQTSNLSFTVEEGKPNNFKIDLVD